MEKHYIKFFSYFFHAELSSTWLYYDRILHQATLIDVTSFKGTSCPSYVRDAVYIFLDSYIEYRFLDYNEFEETIVS